MPRPLIGLTTYAEPARFASYPDTPAAVLPMAYVRAVHRAGGQVLLIPPDEPDPMALLAPLHALVLTGGADVDPARYGQPPHPATVSRPDRDAAELALLRAALEMELPVLGICRGMQLLAVAAGGRLHQHLPDLLGHHGHRPVSGPRYGTHPVAVRPGTLAHRVLGDRVQVNSFHHQGVADAGTLRVSGRCPDDDLVEVVEDPACRFVLGVQWHPEDDSDPRLFDALVAAATAGNRAAVPDRLAT